jgi:hypothetical protein
MDNTTLDHLPTGEAIAIMRCEHCDTVTKTQLLPVTFFDHAASRHCKRCTSTYLQRAHPFCHAIPCRKCRDARTEGTPR